MSALYSSYFSSIDSLPLFATTSSTLTSSLPSRSSLVTRSSPFPSALAIFSSDVVGETDGVGGGDAVVVDTCAKGISLVGLDGGIIASSDDDDDEDVTPFWSPLLPLLWRFVFTSGRSALSFKSKLESFKLL